MSVFCLLAFNDSFPTVYCLSSEFPAKFKKLAIQFSLSEIILIKKSANHKQLLKIKRFKVLFFSNVENCENLPINFFFDFFLRICWLCFNLIVYFLPI